MFSFPSFPARRGAFLAAHDTTCKAPACRQQNPSACRQAAQTLQLWQMAAAYMDDETFLAFQRRVRPQIARWAAELKSGRALSAADLSFKYNPAQPRVPAGNSHGGEWTNDGAGRQHINDGAGGGATTRPSRQQPKPEIVARVLGVKPAHAGTMPEVTDTVKPFNARKAVNYAKENILDPKIYPFGNQKCASHVRQAIEYSLGFSIERPTSTFAKDFGDSLKKAGFTPVSSAVKSTGYRPKEAYTAQEGDVIIIQGTSTSKPGHMAIYTGKEDRKEIWVSDFKQKRGPYPGPVYRDEKPAYIIYRHPRLTEVD